MPAPGSAPQKAEVVKNTKHYAITTIYLFCNLIESNSTTNF
jgi:hypothetical protein